MGGSKRKEMDGNGETHNDSNLSPPKKHQKRANAIELDESCVVPKWNKGDWKGKFVEKSEFKDKYPKYLMKYISESLPIMKEVLKTYGIKIGNDDKNNELSVETTDETWDPYSIVKARQFIELVCRSLPVERAQEVFHDDNTSAILKIKGLCAEKVFQKRRSRVMGPDDSTLDMLERMLKVWVRVTGGTVAIVGSYRGVEQARRFVNEVMKGALPTDQLKELELKLSLMQDQAAQDQDWSHALPSVKKNAAAKRREKKKAKVRRERDYNPLPPAPLESKLDATLEDGKFFLADHVFRKDKAAQQKDRAEKRRAEKLAAKHTAPAEASREESEAAPVDTVKLKDKLKSRKKIQ